MLATNPMDLALDKMSGGVIDAVDLFCGGGGFSEGFKDATGRDVTIAANHNQAAIDMHEANHPRTLHYKADVNSLHPLEVTQGRRVRNLLASPDCTHFSKARGRAPRSSKIRDLIWITTKWAKHAKPERIFCENVFELISYGPLYKDGTCNPYLEGTYFDRWKSSMQSLGYRLDYKVLCAADYGAPTIRNRLLIVARRDGLPIIWPEATHGPGCGIPWIPASECIDWSIMPTSIFGRKKAVVDPSLLRIARGIAKYIVNNPTPFVAPVQWPGSAPDELVSGFMAKYFGNGVTGFDLGASPMHTITTVDHHSLVGVRLTKLRKVTPAQRNLVLPFIVKFYGDGGQWSSLEEPVHTIVTKSRMGLITVLVDGETYAITDIGMRMLKPHELLKASGFSPNYILTGTQEEQIARIGNAIPPPLARAVIAANAA